MEGEHLCRHSCNASTQPLSVLYLSFLTRSPISQARRQNVPLMLSGQLSLQRLLYLFSSTSQLQIPLAKRCRWVSTRTNSSKTNKQYIHFCLFPSLRQGVLAVDHGCPSHIPELFHGLDVELGGRKAPDCVECAHIRRMILSKGWNLVLERSGRSFSRQYSACQSKQGHGWVTELFRLTTGSRERKACGTNTVKQVPQSIANVQTEQKFKVVVQTTNNVEHQGKARRVAQKPENWRHSSRPQLQTGNCAFCWGD